MQRRASLSTGAAPKRHTTRGAITYLATGPVTETSVPGDYCDFAVPFA
jgi:hypothetical protein